MKKTTFNSLFDDPTLPAEIKQIIHEARMRRFLDIVDILNGKKPDKPKKGTKP